MKTNKTKIALHTKTCYMCDELATSQEHVPPKCIFPEMKDLPEGIDLRKELFKVPSCDVHNSVKSTDDEYLMYVLGITRQINTIGRNHYNSKVRRAINRSPSLLTKLVKGSTPIILTDPLTMKPEQSRAIELDPLRFDKIIGHLGRAIYFHHYNEKWIYGLKYQAEFLEPTIDQASAPNIRSKAISTQADLLFANAPYFGKNPEVFKYQVVDSADLTQLRLHFYEGCRLLLIFDRQPVKL